MNHKKHIVSRSLNKSVIIIFIGYQIVNFGRLIRNIIKILVKFYLSKNYLDGVILTKGKITNNFSFTFIHFIHKHRAIKSEIKMFSKLVFWDLLMVWNLREPSGESLPHFNF